MRLRPVGKGRNMTRTAQEVPDVDGHALTGGSPEERIAEYGKVLEAIKTFRTDDELSKWWRRIMRDASPTTREELAARAERKINDIRANIPSPEEINLLVKLNRGGSPEGEAEIETLRSLADKGLVFGPADPTLTPGGRRKAEAAGQAGE
jgi:hypothetical protein